MTPKRLFYKVANPLQKIYWFIFRPKTHGVKVVLRHSEKFLLIRNSYGKKHWIFPGGGIKRNEKPEAAAMRETFEEVGVTLPTLKYLGKYHHEKQYKKDTVYCFFSEVASFEYIIDNDEIEEAGWFFPSDIPLNRSRAVQIMIDLILTDGNQINLEK